MAVAPAAIGTVRPVRRRFRRLGSMERRSLMWGLLFISPWLFGFIVFGIVSKAYVSGSHILIPITRPIHSCS